jgi:ATP/maltotriose-dependent transcriptional regulator MalT
MINFLERDSFLQQLDAALQEATTGQGCVAFVSGEAGIGKTSLVDQFTRKHRETVRVLWGGCDSLFTPRPLGPLHDIALQLEGELPALLNSEVNRQAIFSASLREVQRCPSIIIFEDVHWADEATLDLIKYLGRRIQLTPSLLILTYRDDELNAEHPLRLVLGDLPRSLTLRLALYPLSPDSVSALAHAFQHEEPIDDLYAITGGNPFFVTEVLASGDTSVPATVRDAVLARAARLSLEAREVLDAASVVPGRIELGLLKSVSSSSASAMEECLERGMLRTDGSALMFRHELARRALEDALPPSRKQSLHQRVLQMLREHGEDKIPFSRLVHHAAFAGDSEAVLRYAPQAARQAASVGAHLEAAAHYQTALRYADKLDPVEYAQLLESRAYECYVTSQFDEAIQAQAKALEIWRRLKRPMQEGNNLRALSRLHWFVAHREQSEQYALEAIDLLKAFPPGPELAMAYSNRSQLHMLADELSEAVRVGNQAIALAEQLGNTEILSHALNNVGTAEASAGSLESGRQKLESSLQIARMHELHEHVARAYTNLASTDIKYKNYTAAIRSLNDGIAYSLERDLDSWSLYMLAWRARVHLEQGRWQEAGEDAHTVLNNQRSSSITRIPALAALGQLRVRRGDPDVDLVLDEARDRASASGEFQRIAPVAAARAEAAWWQGNTKQLVAEVEAAYALAVRQRAVWEIGELACWLWRAGALKEPPQGAARPFVLHMQGDWREAALEWERLGCPYEQAMALMDGDEAAQLQALEIFDQLGARPAANFVRQKLQTLPQQKLDKGRFGGLTAREREVVVLIAQGKSNREIAESMTVGVKTVETYVTRILNKLGFVSRVSIATWAVEKGLK